VEQILCLVWGVAMVFVAIIGLFMAANAHDFAFELAGLMLFGFGVLFNFALIARYVGRRNSS
jgi:hypothetical protein